MSKKSQPSPFRHFLWRCFVTFIIPFGVAVCASALLYNIDTTNELDVLNWKGLHTVRQSLADGTTQDWTSARERATCFVLSFSMFALVFLNTILYLYDIHRRGTETDRESKEVLRRLWWCWGVGLALLVLNCVFLVLMVVVDAWSQLSRNQWAAIGFFFVFAILDTLAYLAIRRKVSELGGEAKEVSSSGDAERDKLAHETAKCQRDADYLFKQALYVDIPVVVGLMLVWGFDRLHLATLDEVFVQAFGAGATLVHVATSQLLFAFVSFQDAWHEYQADRNPPAVLLVEHPT